MNTFHWIMVTTGLAISTGCTGGGLKADPPAGQEAGTVGQSVLEFHHHPSRDGVYVDSSFTTAGASSAHRITSFSAPYNGPVYAQPLYVGNGVGGASTLFVATEQDEVFAFRASDGHQVWKKKLGTPVPRSSLPCGNIDPLGVTGTPVIDEASRTLYLDAMVLLNGKPSHQLYALSIDDGSVRGGWPLDVAGLLASKGMSFDPVMQNQRAALALVNGVLYVGFGGHFGDCGTYYGWVVGVPLSNTSSARAWKSDARGGAVWAPGGIASDGTSLYVATGNTVGATAWSGGEAILRLFAGPVFSGSTFDYFAPSNWQDLDVSDEDIGGTNPSLITLGGPKPRSFVLALGKNGQGYLLDNKNLGGVGNALVESKVSEGEIISAPAVYATAQGTYVVTKADAPVCPEGQSGDLVALKVSVDTDNKASFQVAWCASQNGMGSPIVSQNGPAGASADTVVWGIGAEGDSKLHAFDGDTGKPLFQGGAPTDVAGNVRRYQAPIIAEGKIFVATDNGLVAYALE